MSDLTAARYGRLVVLGPAPSGPKYPRVFVRCDCGTEKSIYRQSLGSGATRSCGCLGLERRVAANTKHGHSGRGRTGTYNSWAGMMDRCEWGGHPSYEWYGAAGIRVCERWHTFETFLADMGERPVGTSIDRYPNREGGYEPSNCRWATSKEQCRNTSRTKRVVYGGATIAVQDLCDRLSLSAKAVRARAVRRGNDYVAAFRSVGVECEAA